jgi:hypothetical protein
MAEKECWRQSGVSELLIEFFLNFGLHRVEILTFNAVYMEIVDASGWDVARN